MPITGNSNAIMFGGSQQGIPPGMLSGGSGGSLFGAGQQQGAPNPNDPDYLTYLLQNQTDRSGDPNWKQNIKDYDAMSGLPVAGRYQGYNAAKMLLPAEYMALAKQYGFHNALQPEEHQAVMDYLEFLKHPENASNEFRQQQQGQAMSQSPMLQNQLLSAGAGQGAKEGAALSLFNNANRNANAYDANLYGQQGRANRAQGIMGLVESQNPNLNNLGQLHGIELGTPRNASGAQVVGGLIGQGLGMAGGNIGGLFGGGGGGIGVNHNLYSSPIGPQQP